MLCGKVSTRSSRCCNGGVNLWSIRCMILVSDSLLTILMTNDSFMAFFCLLPQNQVINSCDSLLDTLTFDVTCVTISVHKTPSVRAITTTSENDLALIHSSSKYCPSRKVCRAAISPLRFFRQRLIYPFITKYSLLTGSSFSMMIWSALKGGNSFTIRMSLYISSLSRQVNKATFISIRSKHYSRLWLASRNRSWIAYAYIPEIQAFSEVMV